MVDLILDGEIDPKELAKGTRDEEKEHDMSPAKARKTARQHLTRVDPKYYTKTEKCLEHEGEGPCPHCHQQFEGRRLELEQLGWRQSGWSSTARWTNPAGTYEVYDEVIDQLPEDEWAYIRAVTNARTAADVNLPQPKAKSLGDYERERTAPKATVIGDTTTIGMAAGGA